MTLEMVSCPHTTTITVGDTVFDKPYLMRVPEYEFFIKDLICGPAPATEMAERHRFYAERLGPRFNYRFYAANYWLWVGCPFQERTQNILRAAGRHYRHYDGYLVTLAHAARPYVQEAEQDGLFHLIPLIIAFGTSPQQIARMVGRGAWRKLASFSLTRNKLLMHAIVPGKLDAGPAKASDLVERMHLRSGILRWVPLSDQDAVIAARLARKCDLFEFHSTWTEVRDVRRMVGERFNPRWSRARMAEEHERAAREAIAKSYSSTRFAPDWSFSDNGYLATLLTSPAEIGTEGAIQHHCVGSYARDAEAGRYAVFRIEGSERATLGMRASRNGTTFSVDQIYGVCNSQVSEKCELFAKTVASAFRAAIVREAA